MKRSLLSFAAASLFLAAASQVSAADSVRHVVCIKFKEGTKPEEIRRIEEAFRDLKNKVKEVLTLEWGTNVSSEKRDKGFTHCFILSFVDEKDVHAYAESAAHKAFVAQLGPVMDDVFVIDFHAKE